MLSSAMMFYESMLVLSVLYVVAVWLWLDGARGERERSYFETAVSNTTTRNRSTIPTDIYRYIKSVDIVPTNLIVHYKPTNKYV